MEILIRYARAGYAGLFLCTPEEARAEALLHETASALGRPLHAWSATAGFLDTAAGSVRPCPDPLAALDLADSLEGECLVVLRDFGPYLEDRDPLLVRRLRDALASARACGRLLVLLGHWRPLPPELEREITRVDLPLPGPEILGGVLDGLLASAGLPDPDPARREAVLAAASGLTTVEAENAFALSLVETGGPDPAVVVREKAASFRRGGILEVVESSETLDSVGGLGALKAWLLRRAEAFTRRARDYGLPVPKGMLVLGVPGTGKSLAAKATAAAFGLPLLKLDAGRIFGSLVGQSEANLREAIRTAEAVAPCVLWIDELEKAFGGVGGSGGATDGGTSLRVFGTMLNWLQDKTSPVFVVATANDASRLPPELLRKGRWDECWFVDLPDARERAAIWEIVAARFGRDASLLDPAALAGASERHTGAEIEAAYAEALHRAFAEGREPNALDLGEVLAASVPLAETMAEPIERLRRWSQGRARSASGESRRAPETRRLDLG